MTEKSQDKSTVNELDEDYKRSIRESLEAIFAVCGKHGATVMAATKTVPPEAINYAISCGLRNIGENRVQELLSKYDELDLSETKLHFIGTLQPNKVKYIVGKVSLIHSLDSIKLAKEISKRSAALGIVSDVLCEINIGNEASKSGIPSSLAEDFIAEASAFPSLRIKGIMVIGPHCGNLDDYRPFFKETKRIFDSLCEKGVFGEDPILSMGMSDNYSLAVEYGSTLVRPGSAIFGKRSYK